MNKKRDQVFFSIGKYWQDSFFVGLNYNTLKVDCPEYLYTGKFLWTAQIKDQPAIDKFSNYVIERLKLEGYDQYTEEQIKRLKLSKEDRKKRIEKVYYFKAFCSSFLANSIYYRKAKESVEEIFEDYYSVGLIYRLHNTYINYAKNDKYNHIDTKILYKDIIGLLEYDGYIEFVKGHKDLQDNIKIASYLKFTQNFYDDFLPNYDESLFSFDSSLEKDMGIITYKESTQRNEDDQETYKKPYPHKKDPKYIQIEEEINTYINFMTSEERGYDKLIVPGIKGENIIYYSDEDQTDEYVSDLSIVYGSNLEEEGRIYNKFSNLRKEIRENVCFVIGDTHHDLVEIDIRCCQPRIYSYLNLPDNSVVAEDLYDMDMIDRDLIKAMLMKFPNQKRNNYEGFMEDWNLSNNNKINRSDIEFAIKQIKKNNKIFGQLLKEHNAYSFLQNIDGEINRRVLYRLAIAKIPAMAAHDAWFIMKKDIDSATKIIKNTFDEVLKERNGNKNIRTDGNILKIKEYKSQYIIKQREEKDMSNNKYTKYNNFNPETVEVTEQDWDNLISMPVKKKEDVIIQKQAEEFINNLPKELDLTNEEQLLNHIFTKVHKKDEDKVLDKFWDIYEGDASATYVYNLYSQLAA
jgi:hypothetical protein